MIDWSPEDQKAIWATIFRRKGGDGVRTRLFDELGGSDQDGIRRTLGARSGEMAVIGARRDDGDCLILTTDRLAWAAFGQRREVDIRSICEVWPNNLRAPGQQKPKAEWDTIGIISFDDERLFVRVEPGPSFFGILNVLMNAATRNSLVRERQSVAADPQP